MDRPSITITLRSGRELQFPCDETVVREAVGIAQREHDYIVSIKHRPDRADEPNL